MCSSYSWEHTYRYDKNSQKYCLEFMVTWLDLMKKLVLVNSLLNWAEPTLKNLKKGQPCIFMCICVKNMLLTFDKTVLTFYAAS